MIGAPAQARVWGEDPNADHAPTLAPAPEGLSARRVERWLDLPPGAWQRRRLYALRLKGHSFAFLGFRLGDLVIVEPGAREQPGRIVVTRGPTGPSLRKIPPTVPIERRMPTVLELPLREKNFTPGERVVGTVIGSLRPTGTGALRPIPLSPSRPNPKHRPPVPPAATPARALTPPDRVSIDQLIETQALWRNWVSAIKGSSPPHAGPADRERWERLDASLATLCDCLSRAHSPSLRTALAEEAGAIVATIRSEMSG